MAIVSYDEKPGIQAIATTAPDRPPAPGRHATFARDHEYKRHGTVSLLAGIDLLTGQVHALVKDRHRSHEFIEFLKLLDAAYPTHTAIKLILDNHSAHISKETKAWLADRPAGRFEFIFTPKHGSWLNLVVLLDEAVAIMAADHRGGEAHVFDLGLQLAAMELADLAAEDRRDLVRLADGAIGVEEPRAEPVERGAAMEDEIVAELGLGKEQPMMAAGVFSFCRGKERREAGEPLLAADDEVARAYGAGDWVFRCLPTRVPGEPGHAAWHCRSLSAVAEAVVGEAQRSGPGAAEGPPRRVRRTVLQGRQSSATRAVRDATCAINAAINASFCACERLERSGPADRGCPA